MPEFDDKDTGKGGFGQNGVNGHAASSAVVSDIFQRVGQLGGLMVVAYVAPVSGATAPAVRRTPMALLGIADQVAAARATPKREPPDAKGVRTPKEMYKAV